MARPSGLLTSQAAVAGRKEEAHAYIPRAAESQYAGSRKSMERIAKEGRKYGTGLAVISQRPNELSETVLAQCGTFICLRITNPDDQSYRAHAACPPGEITHGRYSGRV